MAWEDGYRKLLKTHRLSSAFHLSSPVGPQRGNRSARQRFFRGEQPAEDLFGRVARVTQQSDRSRQALDDRTTVQELGGHHGYTVTAYPQQLPVPQHLMDPAQRQPQPLRHIR